MTDYEIDDEFLCPKCNHSPIHWRRCNQCDKAFIDDDVICELCFTTGVESWCPSCGANIQYLLLVESDRA